MSSLLEYNIQSFSSNSDINLLNEVYLLNQSNTPEVGKKTFTQNEGSRSGKSSVVYFKKDISK